MRKNNMDRSSWWVVSTELKRIIDQVDQIIVHNFLEVNMNLVWTTVTTVKLD